MKAIYVQILFLLATTILADSAKAQHTVATGDTVTIAQEQMQTIDVKCFERTNRPSFSIKTYVFNAQAEFEKVFENNCTTLPTIDYNTKTLLVFNTSSSGCHVDYIRTIKIIGSRVIYLVHIVKHGGCEMLNHNYNFIAIPKLDKNMTVEFQKTEVFASEPAKDKK